MSAYAAGVSCATAAVRQTDPLAEKKWVSSLQLGLGSHKWMGSIWVCAALGVWTPGSPCLALRSALWGQAWIFSHLPALRLLSLPAFPLPMGCGLARASLAQPFSPSEPSLRRMGAFLHGGGSCSVSAALRQEWNVAWPAHLPTAPDPEIPASLSFPDDPALSSWTMGLSLHTPSACQCPHPSVSAQT